MACARASVAHRASGRPSTPALWLLVALVIHQDASCAAVCCAQAGRRYRTRWLQPSKPGPMNAGPCAHSQRAEQPCVVHASRQSYSGGVLETWRPAGRAHSVGPDELAPHGRHGGGVQRGRRGVRRCGPRHAGRGRGRQRGDARAHHAVQGTKGAGEGILEAPQPRSACQGGIGLARGGVCLLPHCLLGLLHSVLLPKRGSGAWRGAAGTPTPNILVTTSLMRQASAVASCVNERQLLGTLAHRRASATKGERGERQATGVQS